MTDQKNYNVIMPDKGVPIKAWVKGVQLEMEAEQQLKNVASLPFVFKHIAVMPDCHWGKGATIGSVIATKEAIVPASVGCDIGCGMCAVKTSLFAHQLPDNLHDIRLAIEKAVPHGRTEGGGNWDIGSWHDIPESVGAEWQVLLQRFCRC